MVHLIAIIINLTSFATAGPCTKYGYTGFTYKKTEAGEDRYYNSVENVTLLVKCFPSSVKADDLVEALKKESSIRNTQGDAVYFEFLEYGRLRRVYIVQRKPVLRLTFSTRNRNRTALDGTQDLVEKYFKKTK